jgi:threonine dehydrogenase-like Zn-dependent dehydrogenase
VGDGVKTLRLVAPERFERVDGEMPTLGDGEAMVRVTEVGVCGSDVKMFKGGHPVHRPPLTLGHELIGVVESLPEGDASDLSAGDPVAVFPAIFCGTCHACRNGRPNVCERMRLIGGHETGGMSEMVRVPVGNLVRLPDELPADRRILVEPMAVAVHGANRAAVRPDETAVVLGAGPVGLMTALVLRAKGSERIVIAEISRGAIDRARAFGFEEIVDLNEAGLVEHLGRLGLEDGVEVVLDCAGAPSSLVMGMEGLVPGGRLLLVGVPPATISFDSVALQRGERDVAGSMLYTFEEFAEAVSLLAGGIVPDSAMEAGLVRAEFPVERAQAAFELLASGNAPVLKLVLMHDAPER